MKNGRHGTLRNQLTSATLNPTAELLQRPAELSDTGGFLVVLLTNVLS